MPPSPHDQLLLVAWKGTASKKANYAMYGMTKHRFVAPVHVSKQDLVGGTLQENPTSEQSPSESQLHEKKMGVSSVGEKKCNAGATARG